MVHENVRENKRVISEQKVSRGPNVKAYRWRPGEGLADGQVPHSLGFSAWPSLGDIH